MPKVMQEGHRVFEGLGCCAWWRLGVRLRANQSGLDVEAVGDALRAAGEAMGLGHVRRVRLIIGPPPAAVWRMVQRLGTDEEGEEDDTRSDDRWCWRPGSTGGAR